MALTIRRFLKKDTHAVVHLWNSCGLVVPQNDPHKDIRRKQKVQSRLFLVATEDSRLVGTVMGGYDGHRGWIYYLAVEPSQQKSGIGRLLMTTIEKKLRKLGCPKINLQVRKTNRKVQAFYERVGYREDKVFSYGKRLVPDLPTARRRTS